MCIRDRRSRVPSIAVGGVIGLVVGSIWTAIVGPFTDGPPSIALSFAVYALSLTLTGVTVGAVQRVPALVGLGTGVFLLLCAAFIVGPSDGWIMIWLIIFGGSGFLCGPLIGGVYYMLYKPQNA